VGDAPTRVIKKVQPEGGGNIFIIDSKTFTLGFDVGRADPYHIMERRGRFRGSLWLGLGGLRWLVNVIFKLRNSTCTLEGFFEFFRDRYRVLELSCLSNRGGRFLDISEYHSGAQRGSIRLPEGRQGVGWSLFEFQVRKHFLCEIVIPEHRAEAPRMMEEKPPAVEITGIRNISWNHNHQGRNSRWFRKNTRSAPKPSITVTSQPKEKRESRPRMDMAIKTPRPTRISQFEWKPKSRALRITVDSGSRKKVEWIGLETSIGPNLHPEEPVSGLVGSEAQQPIYCTKGAWWPY
jgi:hypothetical protein